LVMKLSVLDVPRIRRRRFTVALDAVRGAGGPVMQALLERLGCEVTGINLEPDGRFPRAPEPVPENLAELRALVRASGAARGGGGAGLGLTPGGEVHGAGRSVELDAPIGGEGNGGVMYPALHCGRDAPVAAALVLELLAGTGKRVREVVAGAPRYAIVKAKLERGTRNAERGLDDVYAALRSRFPEASADTQDGLRLAWRDRWLHVRPSNTEPIIRLIAEAPTGA